MIVGILILILAASIFSKSLRERLKKHTARLYMLFGAAFSIVIVIGLFLIYAKVISLAMKMGTEGGLEILYLHGIISVVVLIICLLTFYVGWKKPQLLHKNDTSFYISYILLVALIYLVVAAIIVSIIKPVYILLTTY